MVLLTQCCRPLCFVHLHSIVKSASAQCSGTKHSVSAPSTRHRSFPLIDKHKAHETHHEASQHDPASLRTGCRGICASGRRAHASQQCVPFCEIRHCSAIPASTPIGDVLAVIHEESKGTILSQTCVLSRQCFYPSLGRRSLAGGLRLSGR